MTDPYEFDENISCLSIDKMPEFPGGQLELRRFIAFRPKKTGFKEQFI